MSKIYEFTEKATIVYTICADNEEDAWEKLDKYKLIPTELENTVIDVHECFISYEQEVENA